MKLAESVRSYLRACGAADQPKDETEQEQLRSVVCWLTGFLDVLLRTNERWNPYYWVDAIIPSSATVLSPGELKVEGIVICGEHKQGSEWIEPMSATLRVSETSDELSSYQIMCGDAIRGLRTLPYSMRYTNSPRRAKYACAQEWMFRFQSGPSEDEKQ
jgi:hypothetical protein